MIKNLENYRILEWDNKKMLEPHFQCHSNVYSITTTNEFLKYAYVTMYSIIVNTIEKTEIIIFSDFIDIKKIRKFFKRFPQVYFTIVLMNKVFVNENVYWPSIIKKRILLLGHFFSKYKKILSLENDVFIFDNIDELFTTKFNKFISGSLEFSVSNEKTLNWVIPKKYIEHLNSNNNNDSILEYGVNLKEYLTKYLSINYQKYINCGVFLLSFEHYKNIQIENELDTTNKFLFLDQDFINKYLINDIHIIDFKYNFNTTITSSYNIFEEYLNYFNQNQEPKIIHFSNSKKKPWKTYQKNKFYKAWWKYAKKSSKKWYIIKFIIILNIPFVILRKIIIFILKRILRYSHK